MPPYKPVFPPHPDGDEEGENWFITFGDLMALLLCFFILLAAVSTFHLDKYKEISQKLSQAMGAQQKTPAKTQVDVLREEMEGLLQSPDLAEDIEVRDMDQGVAVDIRGGLLFPSASAQLHQEAKPILGSLAAKLSESGFYVKVEGHTDNMPINSQVYPSNWELSAARAAAVARYLISEGVQPERLTIIGYGETRPRAGNDTEEGRALNRRVSLIITSRE